MEALQTQPTSSLLDFSRHFLTEVVRLKKGFSAAIEVVVIDEDNPPPADPLTTFDGVRQHLVDMLESQAQRLGLRGDDREYRRFEEIRYILVAFADEILVSTSWSGQERWRENLLEEEVFHSHDAGERVFAGIEALLLERNASRTEAASVYLQVLALGFQGKFREMGDRGRIAELRRQLFHYVYHREPDHTDTSRRIFPQAYAHTVNDPMDRRLARLWPWFAGIAAAAAIYTAVGHALWYTHTNDLHMQLEKIAKRSGGTR